MPYAKGPGHRLTKPSVAREPDYHDALGAEAAAAAQAEIDLMEARDQLPSTLKFKSVLQISTKWSI